MVVSCLEKELAALDPQPVIHLPRITVIGEPQLDLKIPYLDCQVFGKTL